MTSFSGYLYSAFSGYDNQELEIHLLKFAYLVIVLWRCSCFLMECGDDVVIVPIITMAVYISEDVHGLYMELSHKSLYPMNTRTWLIPNILTVVRLPR